MKKIIGIIAISLLSISAFAAEKKVNTETKANRKTASQEPIEVDTLIKCEDGSDISAAANDLNDSINSRGEVYAGMYGVHENGTSSGDQMIVIKKPFKVSAPSVYVKEGMADRLCVTITK